MNNYYQDISIIISQVSLVSGIYGANNSPYLGAKDDIDSLISELEIELERLNTEEFSEIRDFARQQIAAIIGLLRNVDVFGTDAAYTAYFQLVLSTRRAREGGKVESRGVAERLWPAIERWAGRLAIIEAAVTHSETLLLAGGKVLQLLGGPEVK